MELHLLVVGHNSSQTIILYLSSIVEHHLIILIVVKLMLTGSKLELDHVSILIILIPPHVIVLLHLENLTIVIIGELLGLFEISAGSLEQHLNLG